MAGGRKRTADEAAVGTTKKRETRSAKSAKTDGGAAAGGKPKSVAGKQAKGAAKLKTSVSQTAFLARALPLHINITHTPPAIPDGEEERVPATDADPGFLGTTALVPSGFTTGSYGWKGNKRLTIELPGAEGVEGGGEKERVHVMITINATVIGSKDTKNGDEAKEGEAENGEARVESAEDAPTAAEGEGAPADEKEA